MFGEATTQSYCQNLCSDKVTEKIKLLEVGGGGHVPQCPIAGDANDSWAPIESTQRCLRGTRYHRSHQNYSMQQQKSALLRTI